MASQPLNIAVLGTGIVGHTLGSKLLQLGHSVMMGSRSASNPKALEWQAQQHPDAQGRALVGTFAQAAVWGQWVFNCTSGMATLEALKLAGAHNLAGKILVELANPLDFSAGFPPTLSVCNTTSLGEQVQAAFPDALVVKTLNTVNCHIMVNPGLLPLPTDMFLSGNNPDAKAAVANLLRQGFGWQRIIDLGDISTARGTEMVLPLWVRLYGVLGHANFNYQVVQAP